MEDLTEIFIIENLEQLRALADPLRMRILEQLVHQPATMSQLGVIFGETTAKMHYHVHELERLGFIKLVEKREKGGFIEKYYRAVAKDVKVPPNLLRTSPVNELTKTVQDYFEHMSQEVVQTITRQAEQPDTNECFAVMDETLWFTKEEFNKIEEQFRAMLAPFRQKRGIVGEQAWLTHFIAHTFVLTEKKED